MFSFDQMRMKPLNKVVSKYYVPVNFSFPSLGQDVEKLLLNRNNYKYTQCFALGGGGGDFLLFFNPSGISYQYKRKSFMKHNQINTAGNQK